MKFDKDGSLTLANGDTIDATDWRRDDKAVYVRDWGVEDEEPAVLAYDDNGVYTGHLYECHIFDTWQDCIDILRAGL